MEPYYANRLRKKVEWKGEFPSKKVRGRERKKEIKNEKERM